MVAVPALIARLYELGQESLWIDEAITFGRIRLPLRELIADTIKRKHLPTYFLMLKGWAQLGDSEWMLRFPSAIFGVVTALLAYAAGVVLHGRVAGLAAGLLVAIASGQVHYGQEARMYALLSVATTLALLGLSRLAREPELAGAWPFARRANVSHLAPTESASEPAAPTSPPAPRMTRSSKRAWLYVFAGTVLALYTHNTAAFFVVALNAAAFAVWIAAPRRWLGFARNWLLCMACAFVAWAPWLPTLLGQTTDVREHWRGREANFEWSREVLRDLYAFGDASGASGLLALVLVAVAAYGLRERKRLFWGTLIFATAGTLAAYLASQSVPMFYRRLLIWTGPPWFALIGVGIASLPAVVSCAAGAALLSLLLPGLAAYYARDTKPGWRPLIAKLSEQTDEHSLILSARAERFLTYYYERKDDPLPRRPFVKVRTPNLDGYVHDAQEFFLVGQSSELDYREIQASIARSHRYKAVWTQRSQNAVLIKYRARAPAKREQ